MIEIVSLLSLLTCLGITIYSANKTEDDGGQTVRDSMIEAWQNILIGFSINYFANLLILPQVTEGLTLWDNFLIGWIYTAISMIRSFAIRRWNNKKDILNRKLRARAIS